MGPRTTLQCGPTRNLHPAYTLTQPNSERGNPRARGLGCARPRRFSTRFRSEESRGAAGHRGRGKGEPMRIFRIVNAVPNDHSNETNFDAEPSIAVNPANPKEMVITAFTAPDDGNPNGPVFYSSDGGENWSLRFDIPGGETHDQSPCFARTSGELYLGTLRGDNGNLNALRIQPQVPHQPSKAALRSTSPG
jgi:hypothetical protein